MKFQCDVCTKKEASFIVYTVADIGHILSNFSLYILIHDKTKIAIDNINLQTKRVNFFPKWYSSIRLHYCSRQED